MTHPVAALALHEDLIVVAMNSKLGPRSGFCSLPGMPKENQDGPQGNWTLIDQIAAFKHRRVRRRRSQSDDRGANQQEPLSTGM